MSTSITIKPEVPDQARAKDQAWSYATKILGEKGQQILACNFCNKIINGGGINRFKKHLAGIKGEIAECENVDPAIKEAIQASLKDVMHTKNGDEEQLRIKGQRGQTEVEGLTRDELRAIVAEEVKKAIQATVPPMLEQHMEEIFKRIGDVAVFSEEGDVAVNDVDVVNEEGGLPVVNEEGDVNEKVDDKKVDVDSVNETEKMNKKTKKVAVKRGPGRPPKRKNKKNNKKTEKMVSD